ncbi:hypothetical protein ABZ251_32100, partial [Streptomyces chartreusis]
RAERAPERREYLLAHAKDDWTNIERALTVSLDDVVARTGCRHAGQVVRHGRDGGGGRGG